MYPFAGRLQWLFASRYKHLVVACRQVATADSLVHQRLDSLERWDRIRAVVAIFLYLGLISALGSLLGQFIPGFEELGETLQRVAAVTGAFAGLLTVAFLAMTRLLSQLEIDILMLFILEQSYFEHPQWRRDWARKREQVTDNK